MLERKEIMEGVPDLAVGGRRTVSARIIFCILLVAFLAFGLVAPAFALSGSTFYYPVNEPENWVSVSYINDVGGYVHGIYSFYFSEDSLDRMVIESMEFDGQLLVGLSAIFKSADLVTCQRLWATTSTDTVVTWHQLEPHFVRDDKTVYQWIFDVPAEATNVSIAFHFSDSVVFEYTGHYPVDEIYWAGDANFQEELTWYQKIWLTIKNGFDAILELLGAGDAGKDAVDDLIDNMPDKSEGATSAIGNLTSSMGYSGTDCVLEIPALVFPEIAGLIPETELMESQSLDFGFYIQLLPATLLTLVQYLFTAALIVYCFKEFYSVLAYVFALKGGDSVE